MRYAVANLAGRVARLSRNPDIAIKAKKPRRVSYPEAL